MPPQSEYKYEYISILVYLQTFTSVSGHSQVLWPSCALTSTASAFILRTEETQKGFCPKSGTVHHYVGSTPVLEV